jgi:two-component sensor histidine kinase
VIVGGTIATMVAVLYIVTRVILLASFTEIERGEVTSHVARVERTLEMQGMALDLLTHDWASWDSLYRYMQDGNEQFTQDNLLDSPFSGVSRSFLLFVGSDGEIVRAQGFGVRPDRDVPVPPDLVEQVAPGMPLTAPLSDLRPVLGLVSIPDAVLLVGARAILRSDDSGPPAGVLVMARELDASHFAELSKTLQLPVSAWHAGAADMDEPSRELLAGLAGGATVSVRPVSDDIVHGYGLLPDITGAPLLVFRVDVPRTVYRQGHTALAYFAVSLIVVGLVLGLVVLVLVDRQQRSLESQRFMMRELDHRVKNNLASVIALVDQARGDAATVEAYGAALRGRIHSMARTHEALARRHWEGGDVAESVRTMVEPFAGDSGNQRIRLDGDSVLLPPRVMTPLGLVLHELATNAAKHGAFCAPDGRLDITWNDRADGQLEVKWAESGCAGIVEPKEPGFGLRLVRGLIEDELRGDLELTFEHSGLRCEMVLPRRR